VTVDQDNANLFDRVAYLADGRQVRYRLEFVGNAERWMVEKALRQRGGHAKFRTIAVTVHPAERISNSA
jgi:hypothetical protein